ncbi:sugar phosphate permease [Paraburkholderia atlantica]
MDLEARTLHRVTMRLIPFLMLCYFIAYLDRVNVGFAALQMNKALDLSASAFGFGAGVFFLAYFFFEVPSNLLLERFGARRWIARIMFSWGILAGAMAFIPDIARFTGLSPAHVFYGLRILLGIAEAGFFPGIIFLLTLWFPAAYRGRVVGYFMAAIPLSTVIGGPISGALLSLDGIGGLGGWQWLYLIEAAPAVLLSFAVLFYLTDKPADATWLSTEERDWLIARQKQEREHREAVRHFSVKEALINPRVLAIALIYFGANATNYGLSFFLPQIVKAFGLTNLQTGFVTSLPYVIGLIGMIVWGRHSDRHLERPLARRDCAVHCGWRHRGLGRTRQSGAEDGCAVDCRLRHLRLPAGDLDLAGRVPVGRGGCGRHRRDQFARQSGGFLRPVRDGLDQGQHRRLRRRAAMPLGSGADRDGGGAVAASRHVARDGAWESACAAVG